MRAGELTWAAGVLEAVCPAMELLDLRADPAAMQLASGVVVEVITLDVHARMVAEAEALAVTLGLRRDETREARYASDPDPEGARYRVWRCWSGWVPEGSREAPVWLRVVSAVDPGEADAGAAA